MGCWDRGYHWWRDDWPCSGRVNWSSCGSGRRRLNRRNYSGESSCALWSPAVRWLSIRALGRDARFLLQSLHRTRLRPSGSSTRGTYARRRYWPAFPQTVITIKDWISAPAPGVHPPALALHRSSSTIPATDDDSLPQAISASHQTPYVSRCFVRSERGPASRLGS